MKWTPRTTGGEMKKGPSNEAGSTGDYVRGNVDHDPWCTGCQLPECVQPVPAGGEWIAIDKLRLLAPWIGLASLMIVSVSLIVYVKRRIKRRKKKQN